MCVYLCLCVFNEREQKQMGIRIRQKRLSDLRREPKYTVCPKFALLQATRLQGLVFSDLKTIGIERHTILGEKWG